MRIKKLEQYFNVDKIIFHSIDVALYTVSAVIDGTEFYIRDNNGKTLRGHNVLELQKRLKNVNVVRQVIRQSSAYDEMIGGPEKTNNVLEVPIGDNHYY